MPSAQTANAVRGARPEKRVPLRSHWPIFATFGLVVWPTLIVLCFLVHITLQPPGGSYQGPAQGLAQGAPAAPYIPPAGGSPSAAIEAIVPPQPVGKIPASSSGGPFLTDASTETLGAAIGEYAGK